MVESRSRREFEEILQERDVVTGLNDLDRLVAEARGRREGGEEAMAQPSVFSCQWRKYDECPRLTDGFRMHEIPPQQLFLAHLTPYLNETRTKLEAEMVQSQDENERLMKDIHGQEEEVESIINGLEAAIRDLEGANEAMEDAVEKGDVKSEAREVDREIMGRDEGRGTR